MERYIYYTIIFFSGVILLLYLYLFNTKLYHRFELMLKKRYLKLFSQRIDCVIDGLFGKCKHSQADLAFMKKYIHKRLIQEIYIEKILNFIEVSEEKPFPQLSRLCEELGFVAREIKELRIRDSFRIALACRTLGEFRSPQAITPLLRSLKSYSLDIVYHALLALAKIGDESAFIIAFEESDNIMLSAILLPYSVHSPMPVSSGFHSTFRPSPASSKPASSSFPVSIFTDSPLQP